MLHEHFYQPFFQHRTFCKRKTKTEQCWARAGSEWVKSVGPLEWAPRVVRFCAAMAHGVALSLFNLYSFRPLERFLKENTFRNPRKKQNFLSLWLNAGAKITHGGQVQRPCISSNREGASFPKRGISRVQVSVKRCQRDPQKADITVIDEFDVQPISQCPAHCENVRSWPNDLGIGVLCCETACETSGCHTFTGLDDAT